VCVSQPQIVILGTNCELVKAKSATQAVTWRDWYEKHWWLKNQSYYIQIRQCS